jgi:isocitrate/isopropylmalate dehydrogenase
MKVIAEGKQVTYDLGGTAGTKEMAQAIAANL